MLSSNSGIIICQQVPNKSYATSPYLHVHPPIVDFAMHASLTGCLKKIQVPPQGLCISLLVFPETIPSDRLIDNR